MNDVVPDDQVEIPEETTESSTSDMISIEDRGRKRSRKKNERAIEQEDKPVHYRIIQEVKEDTEENNEIKDEKPIRRESKEHVRKKHKRRNFDKDPEINKSGSKERVKPKDTGDKNDPQETKPEQTDTVTPTPTPEEKDIITPLPEDKDKILPIPEENENKEPNNNNNSDNTGTSTENTTKGTSNDEDKLSRLVKKFDSFALSEKGSITRSEESIASPPVTKKVLHHISDRGKSVDPRGFSIKNKELEDDGETKRREVTSKSRIRKNVVTKKKKKKSRFDSLRSLSFAENEEEAFEEAYHNIFQNKNAYSGWILLGYTGQRNLSLQGSGEKIEDLVTKLEEGQIQYILTRVPVMKNDQMVTRDIFIFWIGTNVTMVEKGRKRTHLGEVKEMLEPYHADLEAVSKKNFTTNVIVNRSDPLSGSHVID